MKRVLCLSLVLTMICALLTFMPVTAETYGDLSYENCGDHIEITDCSESAVLVDIPAKIENLPVTIIGDGSFNFCSNLISINIPNSVTSIGDSAFEYCESLTNIDIPNSVTCISDYTFFGCSSLKNINLPSSITSIGDSAFTYCESLTNIDIPDSVTSMGNSAFADCTALTNINLGNGLRSIGDGVFSGCGRVNIDVSPQNNTYSSIDGVLFNKSKTQILAYAKDIIQPDYTISDNVTSIGGYAFYVCRNLTSINIPNSITSIGDWAFGYCGLTNVNIPDSVTSMGNSAFALCTALTNINLGNGLTSIGDDVFYSCATLANINIPKSVTSIGDSAFRLCLLIKDVYYGGSEADWNNINISSGNNSLLNANIHYNSPMPGGATPMPKPTPTQKPTPIPTQKPTSIPTADPNAPSVEITEVSDGFLTAKVSNCDDLFAKVILAVYNKNGALIDMRQSYNFGEVYLFSDYLQNANIKVMLWSDTDSIKPLAESAEMSL